MNMESVNLTEIYEKLKEIEKNMVTKEELVEAIETLSILSNEDTMEQIRSSEQDIINGKFNVIRSVKDL